MDWFGESRKLVSAEQRAIDSFLLLSYWRRLIDLVFVMKTNSDQALAREYGTRLTNRSGRIMNTKTLDNFNHSMDKVKERHSREFVYCDVDTSETDEASTLRRVAAAALDGLERFQKSVLVVRRSAVIGLLPGNTGFVSDSESCRRFMDAVRDHGEFVDREAAERDASYLQPIPLSLVQHSDRLLRVARHDDDQAHPLYGKFALWAGGHVQKMDDRNGDPIAEALRRELGEELGSASLPEPEPVGLVWDASSGTSGRHVGVVHSLRIDDERDAERLQRAMLNGAVRPIGEMFITIADLHACSASLETWSQLILSEHFRRARTG
jgi:predicted NUDIX family phosphoesterase